MKRFRTFLLLAATLTALGSAPAALLAATPNHRGGGGSSTAVSGVYAVTFNVNVVSVLPAGSTLVCKAQIVPNLGNQEGFNAQSNALPIESATGVATISGSTAACTVEIPFSWTVYHADSGALLSYEIDAVNAAGTLPAVVRTSIQQGTPEAYPASGATSSINFNVTF